MTVVARPKIRRIYQNQLDNVAPLIVDATGCYKPNPVLLKMLPYNLVLDPLNNDSVATVSANGTLDRKMTIDEAGPLLVTNLKAFATSNDYLINIFDTEYGRYLSNRQIHARTIMGNGDFPFFLPIPLIMSRTQSIVNTFTDLSGLPNAIRPAYEGYRLYFKAESVFFNNMGEANKIGRPYFFTSDTSLSLLVTPNIQSFIVTALSEADFSLYRITKHNIAGGTFLIRIFDTLNMQPWTNGFVHSSLIGGTGLNYSTMKPQPVLQRKTKLQLDIINLAAFPHEIFITFSGVNYYYQRRD
jgi:hypothetical protein